MTTRIGWSAVVLAAGLVAAPAQAADQDTQLWGALTVTGSLSDRVDATMEVHTRLTEDAARLGQILLRPGLTVKLPRRFTVTVGYVYFRNDVPGRPATEEHRAWQQIGYTFVDRPGLRLTGRTRIEQRFRVGADETAWRLRQQLRLQTPFRRGGKVSALLWNETFVGFDDTRWGARAGLDQARTFVGVAVPLTPRLVLEPGYLNQYVVRTGADRVNHIALAALTLRL